MSDPFEAMRIPREPAPDSAPGQPVPQQGAAPAAPVPAQPVRQAPAQGSRFAGHPTPGPSEDPFDHMRIRPESVQPPMRPGGDGAPVPAGAAPQARSQSKTLLADVPRLRTYSGSATLGARILARIVDAVVVAAVAVGLWFLFASLLKGKLVLDFSVRSYFAFALVFVALNLIYEVLCTQFGGSTLGRAIFKLHIVQYNTGEVMDTSTSITRQLLPSAAFLVPFAGIVLAPLTYLSALWDPTRLKRDWNDRLTETTWVRRD
ncbi:RDD domain containing protein [Segniliparus rotundus DSM 44985]|uniref:RDD domain containing protein n=1 Tax=Segniliparus rotundus (strain ATCC BAA-972 / CDC 1076 / CIP 108378 / DSM 44985 / JCM 13578) TaxID=640132 RepID=D6Z7P6_SEGRD|nr:RDD family protein [Segniliparus rotundus]ADG97976.1 RDD domain containing protein [Segniliparus rotundus DSM 44985]